MWSGFCVVICNSILFTSWFRWPVNLYFGNALDVVRFRLLNWRITEIEYYLWPNTSFFKSEFVQINLMVDKCNSPFFYFIAWYTSHFADTLATQWHQKNCILAKTEDKYLKQTTLRRGAGSLRHWTRMVVIWSFNFAHDTLKITFRYVNWRNEKTVKARRIGDKEIALK